MGLTFTEKATGVMGDLAYWSGLATYDTSYLTGGELITASDVGLDRILHLSVVHESPASQAYVHVWDKSVGSIMLCESAGDGSSPTEQGSGTNVGTTTVNILALGLHREDK